MLTFDIHGISRPSSTNRRGWILFHKRPIGETIPSYFALVHTMRGGKYPWPPCVRHTGVVRKWPANRCMKGGVADTFHQALYMIIATIRPPVPYCHMDPFLILIRTRLLSSCWRFTAGENNMRHSTASLGSDASKYCRGFWKENMHLSEHRVRYASIGGCCASQTNVFIFFNSNLIWSFHMIRACCLMTLPSYCEIRLLIS